MAAEQKGSGADALSARRARVALGALAVLGMGLIVMTRATRTVPAPTVTASQPPLLPAIPRPGPLSEPRSIDQVGFPADLARGHSPGDGARAPDEIALGQKLFFDGRLSADGTVACATCHDPARAFTDGKAASVGIGGRTGQRNAPTILNARFNATQFWDGHAATLEEQASMVIVNPVEMGQPTLETAVAAIASDAPYQAAFRGAFGRPPNATDLLRAIASYERTMVSYGSPFDRYIAGDASAIGEDAKRGWALFNTRARCNKCHARTDSAPDPTNFTDDDFHNVGIGIIRHDVAAMAVRAKELFASGDASEIDRVAIGSDLSVLGRFLVTRGSSDVAAFKTPDLRNVLVTAPYFHDGSQRTLWDVMDHYNKGAGLHNPWLDEDIEPLALTENEIDDVVGFLASLTGPEYAAEGEAELARQRALARESRPQRDTQRAFGPKPAQPAPPGL